MRIRSHLQLGAALGAMLGSAAYCQASVSQFQVHPLINGYAVAASTATAAPDEGKCGEGKCGIPMMDKNKDGKVSFEESKAGGFSMKQFKAWDANADGFLDKKELDAMHATKGKEGYCS